MSRLTQLFAERAEIEGAELPEQVMSSVIARLQRESRRGKTAEQKMQFFLSRRKINSVEAVRDLHCQGLLEPIGTTFPAGFRILVKKQTNAERMRFTIAHEICHTFFYEFVPELKFAPHDRDSDEERLCDVGAAELLMPATSVRRAARSMPVCLESLERLANQFVVSLAAMFLRLRSLRLWRCELSEWHRMMNGTFVLERSYGGKRLAWEWEEKSILRTAWKSNKGAFGHTFVRYEGVGGVQYFKPTQYEVRRLGERVLALWGANIESSGNRYPLFDGGCS